MWKGSTLSGASSERGSVKADGGRGSGQEKMESSLSFKSTVWSEDTDARVSRRVKETRASTRFCQLPWKQAGVNANVLTFLSRVLVKL